MKKKEKLNEQIEDHRSHIYGESAKANSNKETNGTNLQRETK
jgi:hypothetical protein